MGYIGEKARGERCPARELLLNKFGAENVKGGISAQYVRFGKEPVVDRDASVGFRVGSDCFRVMALGDGKPTGVGLVRYTKAT